jgi:hypothetical protein
MARTAAEDCMFCGTAHAGQCGGKPKPLKVDRARKTASPSTMAQPSVAPPATVEVVGEVEPSVVVERARPNLANVNRVRDPHEIALGRALTIFAERFDLHHEDVAKYRNLIDLPEHRLDAMIWRQVNNESVRSRG